TRLEVGVFALRAVDAERDLDLVHTWMNDPEVAAFWELDGPRERTGAHLRKMAGFEFADSYLGVLDGEPVSYWELYRAALDPALDGHYEALPHDVGLHLLVGASRWRGRGVGTALLREVADRALAALPAATRVLAEPDVRNTRSVKAFLRAGF